MAFVVFSLLFLLVAVVVVCLLLSLDLGFSRRPNQRTKLLWERGACVCACAWVYVRKCAVCCSKQAQLLWVRVCVACVCSCLPGELWMCMREACLSDWAQRSRNERRKHRIAGRPCKLEFAHSSIAMEWGMRVSLLQTSIRFLTCWLVATHAVATSPTATIIKREELVIIVSLLCTLFVHTCSRLFSSPQSRRHSLHSLTLTCSRISFLC